MEVPATHAGRIRDVKVRVGDKVSQGDVLAIVETGRRRCGRRHPRRLPHLRRPRPQHRPRHRTRSGRAGTVTAAATNGHAGNGLVVHASPAIRRFARELGVTLAAVRGSGPNGRITRDDVQGFVKATLANPAAAPATNGAAGGTGLQLLPWPKVDFEKFGPVERVALSRIKKISGPNLARNWVMIPHVTQFDEADVTELEAFRVAAQRRAKRRQGHDARAHDQGLRRRTQEVPGRQRLARRRRSWCSSSTTTSASPPTPQRAGRSGPQRCRPEGHRSRSPREINELAKKARDGKLGPADMTGATLHDLELGGIGGTYFTPIINAPEVAILGASAAAIKPVWDGKAFMPRLILPLSFSYDHRVIDGAKAARFTTFSSGVLADMRRTLL